METLEAGRGGGAPMPAAHSPATASPEHGPSGLLIAVIAIATGALIANLYYAQPLIAMLAPELGIRSDVAGSVVSISQIGYGIGLFLLVSLADLVENKVLVLVTLSITAASLAGAALSRSALPFFAASFMIGLCSTGAQILLPFVAQLVPEKNRGRVVGNVMAGVLTGLMLARPVSLFIAASFGWRAVFWFSGALMVAIGLALLRMMPRYRPPGGMSYGRILMSMGGLLRDLPRVRWRAVYQGLMFAAFSVFWTASPLLLAERFGMGGHAIALFALAGVGGAFAAPLAGRLADRGLGRMTTAAGMLVLSLAFFATGWASDIKAVVLLAVLAILIDGAVQTNHVVSQRIIFSVPVAVRGRVNALYMTVTFVGGALGSVLGTFAYDRGGWNATAIAGGLIGLLALGLFAVESRSLSVAASHTA